MHYRAIYVQQLSPNIFFCRATTTPWFQKLILNAPLALSYKKHSSEQGFTQPTKEDNVTI
jgi:hypothetical protein